MAIEITNTDKPSTPDVILSSVNELEIFVGVLLRSPAQIGAAGGVENTCGDDHAVYLTITMLHV